MRTVCWHLEGGSGADGSYVPSQNDPGSTGGLSYYPPSAAARRPSYPHQSRPFNEHTPDPSRPQWDVPIPAQPQYASSYGNAYPPMVPPFGNDPNGMSAFSFPPPPAPYWSPSMAPAPYSPSQHYPSPIFDSPNPLPPSSRPSQQYYSAPGSGGMVPLPAGLELDDSQRSPTNWESNIAPAPGRRASWIPGTGARPRTSSSRTSYSSDSAAHLAFSQGPHAATYPANSYSQIDPGWAGQLGSSLSSLSQQGGPFVGASPNLPNEPFAFGPSSTASSSRPSTAFSDASLSGYTVQGSLGGSPPARFARLAVAEEAEQSDHSGAHPLVLSASRNRSQKEAAKSISAASTNGPKPARGARSDDDDSSGRRVGRKGDHDCRCSTCGVEIAKLLFRGNSDTVSYRILYYCLECAPLPHEIVEPGPPVEGGYADQLSAAVDRLNGLAIAAKDERPPPRRERATPQRKRRAEEEAVFCESAAGLEEECELTLEVQAMSAHELSQVVEWFPQTRTGKCRSASKWSAFRARSDIDDACVFSSGLPGNLRADTLRAQTDCGGGGLHICHFETRWVELTHLAAQVVRGSGLASGALPPCSQQEGELVNSPISDYPILAT